MSRLEIRLLGGFEVHWAGNPVRGFESQKVRGLCAHLATHRRQALSRERLATLLWAEKSEEAARRNLRQALHNLRSVLAAVDDRRQALSITHRTVQLDREIETWVDVDEFEQAVRRGLAESGPDPYQLNLAASLYTGDFLAGFFIKDSPPFEEWMITEQERHRDAAIDTFRTLIESYLRRGEYRPGIQYARRLLAIDPLSESAHRYLMRLYSLSGRRSRALSQFETLRNLLNAELAVDPMPETRELFEQILVQEVPSEKAGGEAEEEEPVGPLIPMVGRRGPYEQLQAAWRRVLEEGGRLTVVHGESGIGKSRLAKSFVDAATAKRHALVLSGRSYAAAPLVSYRPFGEILRGAFADILPEDSRALLGDLPGGARADLLALAPALGELAPELSPARRQTAPTIERLATSILAFLERLASYPEGGAPAPVILLLDDLQWADPPSRRLLAALVPRLASRRLWVLATSRDLEPLSDLPGDRIELARLGSDEVQEIAASLLGASGSELLGGPLAEWSGGLPLAVAELINTLWDRGVLRPRRGGQWSLDGPVEQLAPPAKEVAELIQERLRRLPTSARRLLAIAAIAGQVFDAELVQKADREHLAVVDICIRLMLERWLIRQFPVSWSRGQRQGDLVLWARGARRGTFEFAHQTIREAVLADINPLRRQILHAELAAALAASRGHEPVAVCEQLAYHYLEAGDWARALPCLELAAEKAHAVGAVETAEWYADRSVEVVDRLRGAAGSEAERDALIARRRAVLQWRRSETA